MGIVHVFQSLLEKVDIVDDNDVVIGAKSRFIVRWKKYRHRGSAIILTRNKKILLQKRSKSISLPGRLCIPGGYVQAGDSYSKAAERELQEEMFRNGQLPDKMKLKELFKVKKETDGDPEYITVFHTNYDGPFELDQNEVEEYVFKDLEEALEEIRTSPQSYTETTGLLLRKYKEFLSVNRML